MHVPNFGGLSGSEDRGGDNNSIQFINMGGWVTQFLRMTTKIGGGRVDDNNILTFLCYWLDKKKCHFKKCIFGKFFYLYL